MIFTNLLFFSTLASAVAVLPAGLAGTSSLSTLDKRQFKDVGLCGDVQHCVGCCQEGVCCTEASCGCS
ncbi:hypothetical protein CDEST_07189 [Colletotrichum destructivum]|uniref:Uncharacterized protein n=1 Tax=Colletotrichum destructivum TaxID=34406 RepID=A0AAX4IFS1_9PEZI|nr:hypothetical protein CDEST_07189 [Colletotrichum destructivum]